MQIKTTADQIADHIRSAIFEGKYLPGDRLKETGIAASLSVSRTPIREAFHKLEAEGLLEFIPNKGVIIPLINDHDIDEILELRLLIEMHCVRKFIRIGTNTHFQDMETIVGKMRTALANNDIPYYFAMSLDFHGYYIRHCQNERMYSFFKSIRNTMRMTQSFLGQHASFFQHSMDEHLEIMRLLKDRAPECEEKLRLHIVDACNRMRKRVRAVSSNFQSDHPFPKNAGTVGR